VTPRLREHPEAAVELVAAIEWYEDQDAGLGARLADQIAAAWRRVAEWPHAWPPFPGWDSDPLVRTTRVDVYPYRVVYFVRGEEIVILAYAHARRRPGYWKHRIEDWR